MKTVLTVVIWPLDHNASLQSSLVKYAGSGKEKAIKPSFREIVPVVQVIVLVWGWWRIILSAIKS